MTAEENKSIIQEFWDIINTGNLQAADDYYDADYIYHGPSGLEAKGPQGFKEMLIEYYTAFPDFHFIIEDIFGAGDKVVSRFRATGTHKAEFMGVVATGKEVEFTGIVISRFENGKVVEDWESLDELSLMQQLGGSLENY